MSAPDVIAEFKQLPPVERARVARKVVENEDPVIPPACEVALARHGVLRTVSSNA